MKKQLLTIFVILTSLFSFGQFTGSNKTINSGDLRFGDGTELSINSTGNIQQPFYYSTTYTSWRQLTYWNFPLDYKFATEGDGTAEWNLNGTSVENPIMSGQVFDDSGFTITSGATGYGTVKVRGTILVGSATLELTNTYTKQVWEVIISRLLQLLKTLVLPMFPIYVFGLGQGMILLEEVMVPLNKEVI